MVIYLLKVIFLQFKYLFKNMNIIPTNMDIDIQMDIDMPMDIETADMDVVSNN